MYMCVCYSMCVFFKCVVLMTQHSPIYIIVILRVCDTFSTTQEKDKQIAYIPTHH